MSVMCRKHDCKSLWCVAILKGQIKMTILLLRSLTDSGQVHDQAGLPVPDTIHFSAILDVNMFVRMYVLQIFWKPT